MKEIAKRKPTMLEAQAAIWCMVAIIGIGMVLGMRVEFLMIIAAIVAFLMSMRLGYKWKKKKKAIGKG